MKLFKLSLLILYLLQLLIIVSACTQQKAEKQSIKIINKPEKEITSIKIDTFSTFPTEIDGCSCYYSLSKENFKNSTYIYVDDNMERAFVYLNGIKNQFRLTKTDTIDGKKYFDNGKYELRIQTKEVGQVDETQQQEGKLEIITKDGHVLSVKIYGECGC